MQQQPITDTPAIEQRPVIERVMESARKVQTQKSSVFWPVFVSYLLSVSAAVSVAFLVNRVFGSPFNQGLLTFDDSLWRLGIPLSLVTGFLLGLFLPVIFARKRRFAAIFYTMIFEFMTLVFLVILGLTQLASLSG